MTSNPVFRGAATALVTPMHTDGSVDYETFGRLIDWQIAEGIDALVIAGTTGESATLSDAERRELLTFAVERIAGRVPCIAGTGSNNIAHAVELTKFACSVGADAMLVVTPYYNKATQKGLIASYNAIADVSDKPIIVYNVPSRTGVGIEPATYAELAKHPNIAAIKEASGNISKIVETAALVGDRLDIYSGNDDQIVPVLAMGGAGVISVLSNIMPAQTSELCRRWFEGDLAGSAKMQCEYTELIKALFCEVNPIPVKAAMAAMGFGANALRLPLTPMESANEQKLLGLMKAQGLI